MSGSWHIYRPGDRWQRPRRDMRIVVATEAYLAVAFSVPVAELLDDRALERAPICAVWAPTCSTTASTPPRRSAGCAPAPRCRSGSCCSTRAWWPGAGNVYRSETLFLAGLDPARLVGEVPEEKLTELAAIAARLLRANVATGGLGRDGGIVTYSGLRRTTGRSDPGARLWVYGRRGRPCRRCGTPIAYRKMGVHARGVYHCPTCQR